MRRREAIVTVAGLVLGTATAPGSAHFASRDGPLVFFGTQTSGAGQGIHAARFDTETGQLTPIGMVAEVARPSWLVAHLRRSMLYSVSETIGGAGVQSQIVAFVVDRATGGLRRVDTFNSGGGGATHLTFDPDLSTLAVANFVTGHVATLPLTRDGMLAPAASVRQQTGSGPHRRQASAHAHGVAFAPGGFLLSADLGADRIFVYRFNRSTRAITPHATIVTSAGSGPRHLAVAPSGRYFYATLELSAEVATYRWDRGTGQAALVETVAAASSVYAGGQSTAELAVSRDGRFLYATLRGDDNVVVYAIDRARGTLTEIQRVASGGTTPWHFALDPTARWLLVANQGSDRIAVFRVDRASGWLTATGTGLSVPKPVNVTFIDH